MLSPETHIWPTLKTSIIHGFLMMVRVFSAPTVHYDGQSAKESMEEFKTSGWFQSLLAFYNIVFSISVFCNLLLNGDFLTNNFSSCSYHKYISSVTGTVNIVTFYTSINESIPPLKPLAAHAPGSAAVGFVVLYFRRKLYLFIIFIKYILDRFE